MYFTIFKDANDKWRWNLKAGNHEIVAQSQAYVSKDSCLHSIDLVKGTNADTPIKEKEES